MQLVADKVDGLILGPSISDDAPEDIAGTAAAGTSGEVPPKDHVHRLPTDNTLAFNSNDELAVNVTDVIDRLNETVEYYSNETGDEYDDNGHASMGEDYDTSAHRHIIHKVQIDINGAGTTNGFWRAGVFAIDDSGTITAVLGRSGTEGIDVDQRHIFALPNPVEVPASQRIRILGSRVDSDGESGSGTRSAHLSRGDEDSASPRESYDDAHLDFARIRQVRANTAFPDVGDTTHDHDADSVRGDIKIWFTTKVDHGDLVGDGNVNAGHIDSGSAPLGDVLTADGNSGATWETPTGGLQGNDGHSPRVGSGNAFPLTPTPLENDIFFFDEDVASGLTWKDTDGTTDLTAADIGDMARYDGTDWIKVVNVIDGDIETLTVTEVGPDFFHAPLEVIAPFQVSDTASANVMLVIEANAYTNRGGFTVEAGGDGRSAIQVPSAGNYTIAISESVQPGTTSATRVQLIGDIIISRGGTEQTTLGARFTKYSRNADLADNFYLSGSHSVELEANDHIEFEILVNRSVSHIAGFGGERSEVTVRRNVGTPDASGIIGAGGMMSPQDEGSNAPNGLVRERVYQGVNAGVGLPLDPPDIWDAVNGEFNDDFSPWSRTLPTLGINHVLAVADGFSVVDSNNTRQNGDWSKYFSLSEQYCSVIQDNNTYTLDSTVAGLRFVRSLLPNGWGAWKPLENGTDGWVEIFSELGTFAASRTNILGNTFTPIDCTFFNEMEIEFWTYGMSNGTVLGGRSQWHYRRTEGSWSTRQEGATATVGHGSFKLFYYDEFGLNGVAALSSSLNDDFVGGITGSAGTPPRRYSFMFHLTVVNPSNPNSINGYQVGPFSGDNQYSSIIVRMR